MRSSDTYNSDDTIAAETTPPGRGGISVIRVSGADACRIVGEVFDRELPEPNCHCYGRLMRIDRNRDEQIDDVVVSYFKAPHSYTGDDVLEISTHGSPIVVAEALDALYSCGARPAKPGEFTLRAFLNERIDLTQAEAVADLINASSREAAQLALKQIKGGIGKAVSTISGHIMQLLTQCELELDFVEDDVELMSRKEKVRIVEEALEDIDGLLSGYQRSRRLRQGVTAVITGPPNVGKSCLFNMLIEVSRAIVHPEPGTTRDVLHGSCIINGVRFDIFDTAGIRTTGSEVEDEGVRRAIETADKAEINIHVSSVDIDYYPNSSSEKRTIHVLNKIDLGTHNLPENYLPISALRGDGIEDLKNRMYGACIDNNSGGESSISRERHYIAVSRAREALNKAKEGIKDCHPAEIIAEELRETVSAMDELTGKNSLESLLDNIFSEFCIGK
ncbi:tRNA uridine-5-carboxymethylaminomethyl(34) synthesis GTPase MnmE [bacterium]|nr:tRNA uridine-5-carboxymethylaminomethyl(34) synthesis GTPase MnmE [bacterium]